MACHFVEVQSTVRYLHVFGIIKAVIEVFSHWYGYYKILFYVPHFWDPT